MTFFTPDRFHSQSAAFTTLLLLTIASACNLPNRTVATPTKTVSYSEPGWILHQKTTEGYGIALPNRWTPISMESDKLEASVKAATQDPATVSSLTIFARNRFDAGVDFLALDSSGSAMLQVSRRQTPTASVNIDSLAEVWSRNVSAEGAQLLGPVVHTRVKLPMGEAQEITYITRESATTQYLVHRDYNVYILTLSTAPDQAARYASVFGKIGQSFQTLH